MKDGFEFIVCLFIAVCVMAIVVLGITGLVSLFIEQPQEYEYIVTCPYLEPLHVFAGNPRYNEAPYPARDFETGNKVIIPQGCVWIEIVK